MICNAIVELHFTLTHYSIGDKSGGMNKSDVYFPELYSEGFEKTPSNHCFSSQMKGLNERSHVLKSGEPNKEIKNFLL